MTDRVRETDIREGELGNGAAGREEEEEERVKRWEWNHSEVQGAVIYCPWLIHSKCVEPRMRRRRGEVEPCGGGAAKRAHRLLGLSAGMLGACQQSHHPLP